MSYLQPAETPPRAARGDRDARRAWLPYFDLSFQHASAAVLRRMRRFGDPDSFLALLDRVRSLAPEAGVAVQRHRRVPGRDRGRPRDAVRLPGRRADGRHGRLRLLRRGRHRGGDVRREARRRRDPRPRRPRHRPGRGAHRAARRRSGSASRSRCSSRTPTTETSRAAAAHQGPEVDGATYLVRSGPSVGELVRAVVVDTEGADLYAREVS